MTEIQIYNPDGTSWGIVPITEGAKHEEELMKTDSVTLSWKSTESVCIPMGSYVAYKGVVYKSLEPYYPQAKDSIEYQYQPVFVSEIFMLSKIPFLLYTNDGKRDLVEADWNFTGRGQDLVSTLSSSIKRSIGVDYVFDISSDIEASLSLSFSNVDILTALNSIASAWGCEWWTDWQTGMSTARIIHFGKKCVHNATDINPYRLTAGQNITMPNSNQKATYFNRFYIFGSTRNIPQDYEGAQATHVINKRLTLNPSKFPNGYIDLPVFDADGNATWDETNKRYITDLTDSDQRFTKVMYFDDIYPKSSCVVSEVKKVMRLVRDSEQKPIEIGTWKSTDAEVRAGYVKAGDVKYDFWYLYVIKLKYQNDRGEYVDFRMDKSTYSPKDNPSGQMIKGLELSLHFNSGSLEGREFKAAYYNETDKHPFRSEDERFSALNFETTGGEFEIVRTEDNTIILPNSGIEPSTGTSADEDGDKVVVFNIRMPEEYYYTAYNELEERAIEYIYDETKDANQYVVKSNPIAFAENVPNLHLGRHITLNIGGRDIDTRVTKLVTNLDRDYEQEITMSKALSKGTINTLLTTIESTAQSVVDVEVMDNTERKLAKQQMMSAIREMKDSMFDTDGYFTAPISPTTIDTMMLSVGATSTNFQLEGILFQPNYAPNTTTPANHNRFNVQSTNGKLIHYGIDIESDSPREWNMSGGDVEWFANGVKTTNPSNNSSFYLYAKCSVTGEGGVFLLDTKQRKYNSDSDYYYFLVGVLSKATTLNTYTSRILGTTYGITTINGDQIKTGRIQSVDGKTYFDLYSGKICGDIVFTTSSGEQEVDAYVQGLVDKGVGEATKDIDAQVETLVDGKVSNIEIGGRNYCRESHGDCLKYLQILNYAGVTLQTLDNVPCLQFDASSTTRGFFIDAGKISSAYDRSSHPWSFAIDVLVEAANTNFLIGLEGRKTNTVTVKSANTWTRLKISGNSTFGTIVVYKTTSGKAYVKNWKLETGTNATDWTAATEDVNESILSAQTVANEATETANCASTTANAAKTAVDNFSVGGRNLLRNTGEKNMTIPANAFAEYNYTTTIQFPTIAEGMTICGQYKVDGWTNNFPPIPSCILGKGDGDAWSRRIYFSTYKTIGSNTRLYQASAVIKTTDANILNVGGSKIVKILAERGDGKAYSFTAYDIKIEIGSKPTDYSPAPEDTDAAILAAEQKAMMADYLRNAIQDGSTTVKGGLILTQMIGVGAGDTTTAGMNGGGGDNPIRFWAGSSTFGDAMSAPFQVYDNGRVVMSLAEIGSLNSDGYGIQIRNGKIEIVRGGSPLTQILPDMASSINDALLDMESSSNGYIPNVSAVYTPLEKNLSGGTTEWGSDYKKTASWSDNKYYEGVIFNSASYTGTATIKSNVVFSGTMPSYSVLKDSNPYWTLSQHSSSRTMSMGWYLYEDYGKSTAKIIQQGSGTISNSGSTITASLNNVTFNVTQGKRYSLVVKIVFSASVVLYANKTSSYYGGWSAQIVWSTGGTSNTTADIYNAAESYKNKYYADGFVLSKANDNYFAFIPTAGKNSETLRLRSGDFVLRLYNGRLEYNRKGQQSLGTSSFYNLSPMVYYGVVNWNSGNTQSLSDIANVYSDKPSVAKISTTEVTFYYPRNKTYLLPVCVGYNNNASQTYQLQNISALGSYTVESGVYGIKFNIKVSDYRITSVYVLLLEIY